MTTDELQKVKEEKYLVIKEILKGFSITEATAIADYFIRTIRAEIKIP